MTRRSGHARPVNGSVLYRARENLGLSGAQMAARISGPDGAPYMDDSRLSKIELGKVPYPSGKLRLALARSYEITVEQVSAPCETCGAGWTAACMDHGKEQATPEPAGRVA